MKKRSMMLFCAWAAIAAVGCGGRGGGRAGGSDLSGTIEIDGSSTVSPISQSVAEEFMAQNPGVRVVVSTSGTGGGMKKFTAGEVDICDASRPILTEELQKTKENGVEFIEVPIAFDGLSVVVSKQNDWADHLTVQELKKIWEPGSTVKSWADVRSGFPAEPIALFGADQASGTFDYFTEAVNGKKGSIRPDYSPSADDNVLVKGVAGTKGGLGFFGLAYYEANMDKLNLVAIDNGKGPVKPTPETISDGSYSPLSRPLFIYVSKKAADRPEVQAFVKFYLSKEGVDLIANKAKYVALTPALYDMSLKRFESRKLGSVFNGKETIGMRLEDLLKDEG